MNGTVYNDYAGETRIIMSVEIEGIIQRENEFHDVKIPPTKTSKTDTRE